MASAASEAAVVSPRGSAEAPERAAADPASAAWLCAIPCAAVVVAAILLLGPPLGHLLPTAEGRYTFLDAHALNLHPEPTEDARYLIALSAPLLAALAIALAARWQPRVPDRIGAAAAQATQLLLAAAFVAALVAQRGFRFGAIYNAPEAPFRSTYFTTPTLIAAALLAIAAAAAARASGERPRLVRALLRDSRGRRWILGAVALAVTVVWILPALNTDVSIANEPEDLIYHLAFPFDETFAVLNGRTPLANFTAQYSSLWPFAIALPMALFGKTLLAFTIAVATIGTLALFAVYGVLRRVVRSPLAALMLFLPFLASSLFFIDGTLVYRSSVGNYFGTFPLRYAGPWFLAWLTARQLDRREAPTIRALWLLFTAGGLALLNNADFGLAAVGASIAALLWTMEQPERRRLQRLAGAAAGGLITAFASVALVTLVRAGTLPQLGRLVDYARIYAVAGFALEPIPGVLGVHLLIYLTYVAAIVVATVRAARRASNRVLTGMLAWAGIFGLGAGMYYVGRSHPTALKQHFGAWSFTLALLVVPALGALASHHARRTALASLTTLFSFGLMACSLAQTPAPWSQLRRLNAPLMQFNDEWRAADMFVPPSDPATRFFVASLADGPSRFVVKRGAPVAILLTAGHRAADAYGVVNVSPYTGVDSLQTVQRVESVLDALRDAGGNTVILPALLDASIFGVLERRGFEVLTDSGLRPYIDGQTTPASVPWPIVGSVIKWVDARHLHPRALTAPATAALASRRTPPTPRARPRTLSPDR